MSWEGLEGKLEMKGWSGTTPLKNEFSTIALDRPIFSTDRGQNVKELTVADLEVERGRFKESRRANGQKPTDDDFRKALHAASLDENAGPERTEVAACLLALFETVERAEERAQYQRVLFAGVTSNEVGRHLGATLEPAAHSPTCSTLILIYWSTAG